MHSKTSQPNRQTKHISGNKLNVSICAIATAVQYSIRPLSALHNPYSSRCSIFCNHPGPRDVKSIVQVKSQRDSDGKCLKVGAHVQQPIAEDQIPTEFYQRFAGSDSRPHTPTPSVLSIQTRFSGSQLVHARRCLTPDPAQSGTGGRKQIVLDLRRSHSQETLFWNASSELSSSQALDGKTKSEIPKSVARQSADGAKNVRLCELEARRRSAERKQQHKEAEGGSQHPSIVCVNDRTDADDEADGLKRRGRKKKKGKILNRNAFHMSNEPETLIAAIGPDSPNASARPSLVPNANAASTNTSLANADKSKQADLLKNSFLNEDALKILRRGLNVDIVESAFERFVAYRPLCLLLCLGLCVIVWFSP